MDQLFSILDELELVCGDEEALKRFTQPDVSVAIEAIRALPEHERANLHGQLDRVQMIMESHLLIYGERMEQLRREIRSARANSTAASQYRRVSVLQIRQPEAQ